MNKIKFSEICPAENETKLLTASSYIVRRQKYTIVDVLSPAP
jgi:hypothetical protein